MKRLSLIVILLCLTVARLSAQSVAVDSTLLGLDILEVMPENVIVDIPQAFTDAIRARAAEGAGEKIDGFRIRIYFGNGPQARGAANGIVERFKENHPDASCVLSFENSFFKVSAGAFRNKSDALRALSEIKADFPAAFVVPDKIKFPDL